MSRIVRFVTALPVATAVVMAPVTASVAWTPTATSAPFDPPAPPATIFEVGGAGWETLPESTMRAILGYRYDTPGNTFVNIEWPAYLGTLGDSVDQASDDLYALIGTTDGPEVAVGLSGSTLVMNEVMRRLDEDPNPPASPDKITFVIVGDAERGLIPAIVALTGPNLPLVNYTAKPIPVTAYNAIVVTGEYDGLADWPDRPWNLLAVANAWLGSPGLRRLRRDPLGLDLQQPRRGARGEHHHGGERQGRYDDQLSRPHAGGAAAVSVACDGRAPGRHRRPELGAQTHRRRGLQPQRPGLAEEPDRCRFRCRRAAIRDADGVSRQGIGWCEPCFHREAA